MEVRLRKLELKDAPFMLEWMRDSSINQFFRFNGDDMTLDGCEAFIMDCERDKANLHYAVVDEDDEYLGTISLKNITENDAEYAVSFRKKAHGTGAAMEATRLILGVAFNDLGIKKVYLNVLVDNERANAFYRKAGFKLERLDVDSVEIKGRMRDLNWYYIDKEE